MNDTADPDDAKEQQDILAALVNERRTALLEASRAAEAHVNPKHPDCGPCAMAGVIADSLRVRAEGIA